MNILHILQNKDKNSALFRSLVKGLEENSLNQSICYLKGKDDGNSPFEIDGLKIFTLGRETPKMFSPSLVSRIAKIIKDCDIDLVHCQRHKPTVYGTLAAWTVGEQVKVVTTVHGRKRTRGFTRKLTNRFIFKRISKIIAVSAAVGKDVLQSNPSLNPDKVVTIYNGIDAEKFLLSGVSEETAKKHLGIAQNTGIVFGTAGRLAPVKNHDVLLRAFAKLLRKHPRSLLLIAGAGKLEQELKKLSEMLAIQNRVIFLGYRKDIQFLLRALDCFVLPSLSEGHPLALLEAMAAENMVIASQVGGVPEILSVSGPGIMVPPGCVESLAEAMEKVCQMTGDERSAQGEMLRQRVVENYTVNKMVSAVACLYREVIGEKCCSLSKCSGN
jgi:glycosyltransferase involved in cell wall biosynthesis